MEATSLKQQSVNRKTCLQTPHTLRLLKLIHEGTPRFASLAVDRLPTNASAAVLWDLMGRLQAILTSTEWKTRQAAARAMEKLGKQLDAEAFLNQDNDKLSMQYVLENMSTIVSQTPLYGSSQSRYDLEEGSINEYDVAARVCQQRELLAKRLGLDSIGDALGSDQTRVFPMADEDFVTPKTKRAKQCHVADDAILLETTNHFTALLVRQSECGDNALHLLTAELVYRMFHPSWWMRHGAILGLMSLTKAFSTFGRWTESVLSRALCILALDRFGDFSGDTVAPVRETAAQLVATILHTAPAQVRDVCVSALLKLVSNPISWEIQHGAMSAIKFMITLKRSDDSIVSVAQTRSMIDAAIVGLENPANDDVLSAAACVLIEWREIAWQAAKSLWSALNSTAQCSSAVVQLVTLLKRMAIDDSRKCVALIGEDPDSLLLDLLGSPFQSVRHSTLEVVGAICSTGTVVKAVFELHYDTEMPQRVVQRSWESLCSRCSSLSIWRTLLDRYFSPKSEGDVSSFPKRAATALSRMYKSSFLNFTRLYLLSMMQSPCTLQCEKSLLLFGLLEEFEMSRFADLVSVEGNLLCMSVGNYRDLSKLVALHKIMTTESIDALLSSLGRADEIESGLCLKLTTLGQTKTTKPTGSQIMRIKAGIVTALVSKELLPDTVSPLVRALVTSFNNECESNRRNHTADGICNFIKTSIKQNRHGKAVSKLVHMICDLASSEGSSDASQIKQRESASQILRQFVFSVQDIPPLWQKLSAIIDPSSTDDEKMSSIWIINAVAKGLTPSTVNSASSFVTAFVGPLVDAAKIPGVRSLVSDSLLSFCKLEPEDVLEIAVPKLMAFLNENRNRVEYCQLLHDLIQASEASIASFIRVILPEVMSLITDRDCSRIASSMFATLVRCAPLVARNQESEEAGVIDHLIFGEPLPPPRLPRRVEDSLKTSSIVLRNYQLEGISWLHFLQKVNLSGALCDGK